MVEPLEAWAVATLALAAIAEAEPAAWRYTRGAALLHSRNLRIRAALLWVLLLLAGWALVAAGTTAWASLLHTDGMPGIVAGVAVWTTTWVVSVARAVRAACQLERAFGWAWGSR